MILHKKVLNELRQQKSVRKGSTILIGVSGGIDSIVLAKVMYEIRHALGVRLYFAHFNHRLRKTSARDEKFVDSFSKKLNIPLIFGRHVHKCSAKKISEDEARTWRFEFFTKAMRTSKADLLMLAHNQNDLAETVLMRVIRGTGLHGIRGILKAKNIDGIEVLRPLLGTTRNDIELYAEHHHLTHCEDETNKMDIYLRNRIRRDLIPVLKKDYNPSVVCSLAQLAQSAGDDYSYLQEVTKHRLKENMVKKPRSVKIKLSFFQDVHIAIARLGLRCVYEELSGDLNKLCFDHVQNACHLAIQGKQGSVVHWPNNFKIVKLNRYLECSK